MFASTRIAVALCAAVAMVLGAMSVGASRRDHAQLLDAPLATAGPLTSRARADSHGEPAESLGSVPRVESYRTQETLAVKPPIPQQMLLVNPNKPQGDISLEPIKTLITEEKIYIDLDVPVPALVPLVQQVPVEAPTDPITEPLTDTIDTLPPMLQPTTEIIENPVPQAVQDEQQPLP